MAKIIEVKLGDYRGVSLFDINDIHCNRGDRVIMEVERGTEQGEVVSDVQGVCKGKAEDVLGKVLRQATEGDIKQMEINRQKALDAVSTCIRKIHERKLEMQIVKDEYSFDSSKVIFFFTAELSSSSVGQLSNVPRQWGNLSTLRALSS